MTQYKGCVERVNVQFLEEYLLFRLQEEADRQSDIRSAFMEVENRAKQELESLCKRKSRAEEYRTW